MRGGITSGVGFGVLREDEDVFINLCWPLFSLPPVFLQKRNIALFPRKGPKSPSSPKPHGSPRRSSRLSHTFASVWELPWSSTSCDTGLYGPCSRWRIGHPEMPGAETDTACRVPLSVPALHDSHIHAEWWTISQTPGNYIGFFSPLLNYSIWPSRVFRLQCSLKMKQ